MYLIQRHTEKKTEVIGGVHDMDRALEDLEWYASHDYREDTTGFSVSLEGKLIAEWEI